MHFHGRFHVFSGFRRGFCGFGRGNKEMSLENLRAFLGKTQHRQSRKGISRTHGLGMVAHNTLKRKVRYACCSQVKVAYIGRGAQSFLEKSAQPEPAPLSSVSAGGRTNKPGFRDAKEKAGHTDGSSSRSALQFGRERTVSRPLGFETGRKSDSFPGNSWTIRRNPKNSQETHGQSKGEIVGQLMPNPRKIQEKIITSRRKAKPLKHLFVDHLFYSLRILGAFLTRRHMKAREDRQRSIGEISRDPVEMASQHIVGLIV